MIVRIHPKGVVPEDLARHIEQHLHFTLGRFAARIGVVTVRLSDNGQPDAGKDKACQIHARLGASRVEGASVAVAQDFQTAADRAIRRVENVN